jgi:hypothetical protein
MAHWTTLLKEDKKPKCYGKYPSCPKHNGSLDPMDKIEIKECPLWRMCRTEYLSKVFNNPSFKHGQIYLEGLE